MQRICILGSTGSIGTQTLTVIDHLEEIEVVGLTTNTNIELLEKQISIYRPKKVAVMNEGKAKELKLRLQEKKIEVLTGLEGIIEIATMIEADLIVTAIVGMIGLQPTIEAIKAKKNIALANKETLVTAGQMVMELAKENKVHIYPVDSEHSAIFQCLNGSQKKEVNKIILTASGGPFRGKNTLDLTHVTAQDALKHPNWEMGKKITIDSATMMNKGLEVIEAKWLFDLAIEQIEVLVHPQSMIHSMVEFVDGAIVAQLGQPDMRMPIQYALTYPRRVETQLPRVNFLESNTFTFEAPDLKTFYCLQLAYDALKIGGTMPTVLNAANEVLVEKFLCNQINFLEIPKLIEEVMNKHNNVAVPSLEDILNTEKWTRKYLESRWII